MKQHQPFHWDANKYYRCRPVLYYSCVINSYLADIEGTQLFFYQLHDLSFYKSIQVLKKQQQFYVKMKSVNDNTLAVFGMYEWYCVSAVEQKVTDTIQIKNMIEQVEAKNDYVSILTSDEEGQNKLVYCWKINAEGKVEVQFPPVEVNLPEFQECTDDKLELAIIESVEKSPKIYLFWKNTNNMIEVDPTRRLLERYNRTKSLTYVTDIDQDSYGEICGNKIYLCSKKGGKQRGTFFNEKEQYRKLITLKTRKEKELKYFSISDQGVKEWKLEKESQPIFFADSDKYLVDNLYYGLNDELVGINLERKLIIIWQNPQEVIIHNFPEENIRKILRVSDTRVCLMLEAMISKELENQFKVEKHNKMEIYDFTLDKEIAKKAVLKLQYNIDINSSIVANDESILFILNEETNELPKRHIFRWSPFNEDKKKEVKKREIVGAHLFDEINLYSFDRILTFKKAKQTQMYDLFNKTAANKSIVTLFDFSAKKIGEYELNYEIKHVTLTQNEQLLAVGREKFSIYRINSTSKNRLEKVHELDVSASFVKSIDNFLIMKKQNAILIYDADFDLLMKEEEEEDNKEYRIFKISNKQFIMANEKEISYWNLDKEEKKSIKLSHYSPSLLELIDKRHLLVADKWIRAFDFESLYQ